MKRAIYFLCMALSMFACVTTFGQGATTSSILGQITGTDGETLIGVSVVAVHEPTGTTYGAATDLDGYYRMDNVRVGGPYTITATYVGQEEVVIQNVQLRLGEPFKRNISMGESAVLIDEVVVVAQPGSVGKNAGTSTQISAEAIQDLPTLNRNIADFTRLTPTASTAGSGTSFGGVNNRYNAIYIDGAVNNDVFGLAGSGTNGGQTGISPVSIDIIDQLQVVLSPYDVTFGGFAGGGVNAVTKSGTNKIGGTAYYFLQNESLVGKTNQEQVDRLGLDDREKVADFKQSTYGLSLGGPIKKDKIFFFVNAEIQKDETPRLFNIESYNGASSTADLDNLRNTLINTYNYDPGSFGNTADELDGLKLFGKLDFNLSQDHKLTVRHQYTKAEQFNRNASNSGTINFSNNGVFFPHRTHSSAIELNSSFGSNKSNSLIIGYTNVEDDRDPLGNDFPYVIIFDDGGEIEFGSEQFSTANFLSQKILTITDNFKIYKGKHTFTLGTHNEFYSIRNVFLPFNFGVYEFDSVDDFIGGNNPVGYQRVYSLVDNISGDETAAAADFKAMQLGLYVQDQIELSDRFTVTAGLRVDVPILTTDPAEADRFNDEVLPRLFEDYPEFSGNVEAGSAPDGQLMFSPRVGFSYDISDNSKLRGGVGIFTSRIPFVWPGAMYNTNGLTSTFIGDFAIDNLEFRPNVQNQYTFETPRLPSGDMNLFTKDFKYPQVLRGNLAFDTRLGNGWNTSIEGTYTKTLNNVRYTNLNTSREIVDRFAGSGDDRAIYDESEIDEDDFGAVYLGSNTNEGYAYNFTALVNKSFSNRLNASLAVSYGDSYALFEGTSSQNSSQWRGAVNIDGRNNAEFGRSDFALGTRVVASLDYYLKWSETIGTNIALFFNGQSGLAMSYVIGGDRDARNLSGERGSTSRWRSLVYVPTSLEDANLVPYESGGQTITAAEQWENLNSFIEDDSHLSERRGDYAEKNGARAPWTSMFDLAIRQDFGIKVGDSRHRFQLSFDVFNVANLLNKSWGTQYFVPGDFNNYELLNFEGFTGNDNNEPTYSYRGVGTADEEAFDIANFNSRWRGRIGIRYIFD